MIVDKTLPAAPFESAPSVSSTEMTEPPSYRSSESTATVTADDSEAAPAEVRVNYVYVSENNNSAKGSWTIDPNVRVPPRLLPTIPDGEERRNFYIFSRHNSVAASLRLISNELRPTRSTLYARSEYNSVKIQILSRQNQRFHLKAESSHGSVTVYIPLDFEGPLTYNTGDHGSIKFSEAIQQRLAHFGGPGGVHKAFIGSLEASGFADVDDDSEWTGDELYLSTTYGSIKVYYTSEGQEPGSGGVGFFKRFFGGGGDGVAPNVSSTPSPPGGSSGPRRLVRDRKS